MIKKFKSKLAGSHYYQPAIDVLLLREEPLIRFELDPSCEYDENAIRILDAVSGAIIGYVDRNIAEEVSAIDGTIVEIVGHIMYKNKDICLEFECKYEPLPTPTEESLLEQVKYFEDLAIGALQDFIIEISSPKYSNLLSKDYIGNAERALYLIDHGNYYLSDSESIKRQKLIEKLLDGNGGMRDDLSNVLHGALIEYSAPNKPQSFFNFPNASALDMSCRFYGKTVLFTGFWPEEKMQLSVVCNILNLSQAASICNKLDFLICGTNAGPSKMKKADLMNIPIIKAENFIKEITKKA